MTRIGSTVTDFASFEEADAGLAERRGSAAGQAGARPLVNIAKSSAASVTVIDEETGEIQRLTKVSGRSGLVSNPDQWEVAFDPDQARWERFALQRVGRGLLEGRLTPRGAKWRLCSCCARRVGGTDGVAVMFAPEAGRAHFGNLVVCASVWVCPVCSAKISERRKAEVAGAAEVHRVAGGGLYMVTLTWAHQREDVLSSMLERSRVALKRLRERRSYVKRLKGLGYVGMVRALEVTHGEANGWHPHFHELWLLDGRLSRRDLADWQSSLFDEWHAQCARAGLGLPNRRYGVDIRLAETAGDYLAKWGTQQKWGVAGELAKAVSKRGGGASRTPWELLRLAGEGSGRCAGLWVSYADAFYGARQLFWTAGLKAALGVEERSDEEVATEEEQPAQLVCMVSPDDWRLVLAQPYEARAHLLTMAERGGSAAVAAYLDGLRSSALARAGSVSLWATSGGV